MRLTVTVVITNYNHGQYLGESVASVLSQRRAPERLLVIDDGSNDNSERVLESLPDSVEVLRQPNRGIVWTRNRALSMIETSHVVFLDADDYLHANYVKWTEKAWRAPHGNKLALVYTAARLHVDGSAGSYFQSRSWSRTELGRRNFVTNTALMSVNALRSVGGYSAEFEEVGHEDWDLILKLAEFGWTGRYLPFPLFSYRILPVSRNSISALDQSLGVNRAIKLAHPWARPGSGRDNPVYSPSALVYKAAWRWDLRKWRRDDR